MLGVKLLDDKTLQPYQQGMVDEYNEVKSTLLNLEGRLEKLNDYIFEHRDLYENPNEEERHLLRFQRIAMGNVRRYLEVYLNALAMRMKHQGFATYERKGA